MYGVNVHHTMTLFSVSFIISYLVQISSHTIIKVIVCTHSNITNSVTTDTLLNIENERFDMIMR